MEAREVCYSLPCGQYFGRNAPSVSLRDSSGDCTLLRAVSVCLKPVVALAAMAASSQRKIWCQEEAQSTVFPFSFWPLSWGWNHSCVISMIRRKLIKHLAMAQKLWRCILSPSPQIQTPGTGPGWDLSYSRPPLLSAPAPSHLPSTIPARLYYFWLGL